METSKGQRYAACEMQKGSSINSGHLWSIRAEVPDGSTEAALQVRQSARVSCRSRMHVLIVSNPISGAGKATRHAQRLADQLMLRGHHVSHINSEPQAASVWLAPVLAGADRVAVVGGDGTVRSVALVIADAGLPMVHVPQGNENLFARTLGMPGDVDGSIALIEHGERAEVDIALANGHAMLLMASIGADAAVVARVAAERANHVSHMHYVWASMKCFLSTPPRLTIRVDGELVVPGQRGWVVVSNSPHYGARINPAPMASMQDGLLDLTFFRASSGPEVLNWMVRCRFGLHRTAPGFVHRQVKDEVLIEYAEPAHWQLDGDPPPETGPSPLAITHANKRLTILQCGGQSLPRL